MFFNKYLGSSAKRWYQAYEYWYQAYSKIEDKYSELKEGHTMVEFPPEERHQTMTRKEAAQKAHHYADKYVEMRYLYNFTTTSGIHIRWTWASAPPPIERYHSLLYLVKPNDPKEYLLHSKNHQTNELAVVRISRLADTHLGKTAEQWYHKLENECALREKAEGSLTLSERLLGEALQKQTTTYLGRTAEEWHNEYTKAFSEQYEAGCRVKLLRSKVAVLEEQDTVNIYLGKTTKQWYDQCIKAATTLDACVINEQSERKKVKSLSAEVDALKEHVEFLESDSRKRVEKSKTKCPKCLRMGGVVKITSISNLAYYCPNCGILTED